VNRLVSGFAGAVAEAWQEFRVHRGRVLLALVGVAVAITALTSAIAVSRIAQQVIAEEQEAYSGRAATLTMYAWNSTGTPEAAEAVDEAWTGLLDRYGIQYATRMTYVSTRVQFPTGIEDTEIQVVDPDYAVMHRLTMLEGSWFSPGDAERLVPVIVVNEAFWDRIGRPDVRTHPIVTMPGLGGIDALVIGVYAESGDYPSARMLTSQYASLVPDQANMGQGEYRMWVPVDQADALADAMKVTMTALIGAGPDDVQVQRSDYGAWGDDGFDVFRLITVAIAAVILLLGALGLLNIALVSVKQRIREIGIRRSYGATSGRVFFSVLMESVVATAAAGFVGVMLSIILVRASPIALERFAGQTIQDVPPFPAEAAVIGLLAATVVGALAGIIPALIAVRVKVIDAIRF
jgi:putative ABC transport system permease protein